MLAALLLLAIACPAAADPEKSIARLGWLEGHWSGGTNGARSEEIWTSPEGGALIGLHKDIRDGKVTSFEFLRIAARGDSVCYFASPRGASTTVFCLAEIGERRVVFENPEHDFPQRILYWLDDESRLHARVEGTVGGEARGMEWVWERRR
jgi:hypothetical protein